MSPATLTAAPTAAYAEAAANAEPVPPDARAADMSVPTPDTFIIGAPKCGTTALAHYLSQHPQFFLSGPKEPFFWDDDHGDNRVTHELWTLDRYLKLFAAADPAKHRAIGEGSTTYFHSEAAVPAILRFRPDAKFIVMLRNPVQVAHGMHGELRKHFLDDVEDFEEAWRLQEERAAGRRLPHNARLVHQLQYRQIASFAPQLRRFFETVPEAQRKVIVFDDFVGDTRAVYKETLDFLGLDDDGRTDFPKMNPSRQYRLQWLGRLYQSPPGFMERPMRRLRSWVMAQEHPLKRKVQDLVARKQPRAKLRPEFVAELRETFRPDLEETGELLGRDLTHWVAEPPA